MLQFVDSDQLRAPIFFGCDEGSLKQPQCISDSDQLIGGQDGLLHQVRARLFKREQVGRKISTVDRRDIAWFKRQQAAGIVPIE